MKKVLDSDRKELPIVMFSLGVIIREGFASPYSWRH
jgi:hypothetical protein